MGENLVIVESPAKAQTIAKFLGSDYIVKSSIGHIRDLAKKNSGIDIKNGFAPLYEIPADKKKVVTELKTAAKNAATVWLASDEDREGEAIAWHLYETLGLKPETTHRIAFHEITKEAILKAIENPRNIDMNLVMAQQARRVLDRLVGFELSPILWRKVQPKLSAGRVQSVALRLVVDREREIAAFRPEEYYRIEGVFTPEGTRTKVTALLDRKFKSAAEATAFLEKCRGAKFIVSDIEKKESIRTPAAPFTTSVLQQEAARRLGFSVSQTMSIAQHLYEAGLITYMRTDSVNLSSLAINTAKQYIVENYGKEYSKVRKYDTRSKGAQEAHEAIRPTYIQNTDIEGTSAERRLYQLIWKRTIACQMADAKVERTILTIAADGIEEHFSAEAEKILFDGYLRVNIEGKDEDEGANGEDGVTILPAIEKGQGMNRKEISATQKFTTHPARYSEGTLVKKLEELGIGRPSTYASTISTIMKRGYVVKNDRKGESRQYQLITLKGDAITTAAKSENAGAEKGRLFPENIGMAVTDYLGDHFPDILNYGFTATVEEDFDRIAAGERIWNEVIAEFYSPFHNKVEETLSEKIVARTERVVGNDPATGKPVIARMGRYGALVQIGNNDDADKKFASMRRGQLVENITLEDALKLFDLPRTVGTYNGQEIIAAIGRFGPYVKYNGTFVSLGKKYSPYSVTEQEAVALIEEHQQSQNNKNIAEFPEHDIKVLNGRYGPYIKQGSANYKIPKGTDPSALTEEECLAIIAKANLTSGK
ncbi:MAG: type I DNA topoisomerase [Bacteroidales bacterium]|nr:type I DNA topoisomerase [Bacteroidales bacterium]